MSTHPIATLFCAAALATTLTATPQADPLVPATELRPLDGLALKLAKAARDDDAYQVLDVLKELGYPDRTLNALRDKCEKAMKKAKPGKLKAAPLVKALDEGVAKILAASAAAGEDQQKAIANAVLSLDASVGPAHTILGHEQTHGRWVEPWMKAVLDREVEIERALAEAKAFTKEPARITISDDRFLETAMGKKGTLVSGFGVTVHASIGRDATQGVVQDFARASSFANFLLTGKVTTLRPRPFHYVFLHSKELYDKFIDALQADGRMPADEAATHKSSSFFWEARNEYLVMYGRTPQEMSAYLISESLNNLAYRSQQIYRVGLANYVCLAVLGRRLTEYTKDQSSTYIATNSDGRRLDAQTTLLGLRTFAGKHAASGRDPKWSSLFEHTKAGDFQGDDLVVATSVMMFLCAERTLEDVLRESPIDKATTAPARITQLEAALGGSPEQTVAAIEARWAAWARNSQPSLADTLRNLANRKPDKVRTALLKKLDTSRSKAVVPRGEGKPEASKLSLHPLLSSRAEAHARYLESIGAEAAGASWQAAHVQDPAQAAFSIAGMRAGPKCVIAMNAPGETGASLDRWLASWDTRLALLHPGLKRIGYGATEAGVLAMDCLTLRGPADLDCTVQWPYPGQKNVPTRYAQGAPLPFEREPDAGDDPLGYPISVQVFDVTEVPSGALELKLFLGAPTKGAVVDCYSVASGQAFGLIPKQELEPRKEYTVVGTFADERRLFWKFKT